eukprot:TRINITY_DN35657_c0_g1_i1.p1 TRINITY_DN35657_c0_g1~~TRINITY_DN35657_c0_g1_i1.p1  ORF type:complete len:141 (+),score=10.69 TRINITY_DN35657_c0_g1_i1:43-423(+)
MGPNPSRCNLIGHCFVISTISYFHTELVPILDEVHQVSFGTVVAPTEQAVTVEESFPTFPGTILNLQYTMLCSCQTGLLWLLQLHHLSKYRVWWQDKWLLFSGAGFRAPELPMPSSLGFGAISSPH